jgi:chromosome segregation ATPase
VNADQIKKALELELKRARDTIDMQLTLVDKSKKYKEAYLDIKQRYENLKIENLRLQETIQRFEQTRGSRAVTVEPIAKIEITEEEAIFGTPTPQRRSSLSEIYQLNQRLDEKNKKIENMNRKLELFEKEQRQHEGGALESLRDTIKEQNQQLDKLKYEYIKSQRAVENYGSQVDEKRQSIDALDSKIRENEAKIEQLQRDNQRLQAENETLHQRLESVKTAEERHEHAMKALIDINDKRKDTIVKLTDQNKLLSQTSKSAMFEEKIIADENVERLRERNILLDRRLESLVSVGDGEHYALMKEARQWREQCDKLPSEVLDDLVKIANRMIVHFESDQIEIDERSREDSDQRPEKRTKEK